MMSFDYFAQILHSGLTKPLLNVSGTFHVTVNGKWALVPIFKAGLWNTNRTLPSTSPGNSLVLLIFCSCGLRTPDHELHI